MATVTSYFSPPPEVNEWIEEIYTNLQSNDDPELVELRVNGKDGEFGDADMVSVSDSLRRNNTVTSFSLCNVKVTRAGVLSLVAALKDCTNMSDLTFGDIDDSKDDCLAEFLAAALFLNPSIQHLSLHGCWIHDPPSAYSLGALVNTGALHLQELRLTHNRIDRHAAAVVASAIKHNKSIKVLDLTGNGMDCAAVSELASGLACNDTIQSVILDFNAFGDDGITALSHMLKTNQSVTELHLFGNRVSGVGASQLAEALTLNACLQSLILSFNRIGDIGAAALALALTVNTTLTKIWLPSNSVGCEGIQAFAKYLPLMKGLEQLNVGMLLDDWVADALVAALKYNIRLSVLSIEKPIMFEEDDEQQEQSQAAVDMDFYLRLNRSGRRLLREDNMATPIGLWSNLLAHAASNTNNEGTPDVLYYLLQQKPDLACGLFETHK